jgi:hypothetical protein
MNPGESKNQVKKGQWTFGIICIQVFMHHASATGGIAAPNTKEYITRPQEGKTPGSDHQIDRFQVTFKWVGSWNVPTFLHLLKAYARVS